MAGWATLHANSVKTSNISVIKINIVQQMILQTDNLILKQQGNYFCITSNSNMKNSINHAD